MSKELDIPIDHLRSGTVQTFEKKVSSDFIAVSGQDYSDEVFVDGEVYITEDMLVLHFNIAVIAILPCTICNQPVQFKIVLKSIYHTEPLNKIKAGIFDMEEVVRENILLETPAFIECHDGHCPKRKELKKYLKEEGDHYQPFKELDFKALS